MSSCRLALLTLIIMMGDPTSASEATWVFQDKTVTELKTQCPATFGNKAIEAGSPEYVAGMSCLSTMLSLIEYLNRMGKICTLGTDVKVFQMNYSTAMKAVGKAAKTKPDATIQSIVEPHFRKHYPCK